MFFGGTEATLDHKTLIRSVTEMHLVNRQLDINVLSTALGHLRRPNTNEKWREDFEQMKLNGSGK